MKTVKSVGSQKRNNLYELIMRIAKLYREVDKETRIRVGEKMLGGKIDEQSSFDREIN